MGTRMLKPYRHQIQPSVIWILDNTNVYDAIILGIKDRDAYHIESYQQKKGRGPVSFKEWQFGEISWLEVLLETGLGKEKVAQLYAGRSTC